jgi:SecD/SecF fusion protein
MLQVSFFTKIIVALVVIAGILVALPNAFTQQVRERLPHWLPHEAVTLGLDLQGGSYLLMQADLKSVEHDKAESLIGDIRIALRKARIGYADLGEKAGAISVRIRDAHRYDDAKKILNSLNPAVGGSVLGGGSHEYELTELGSGRISMRMTDAYRARTKEDILEQSVEVVRKRIDAMGTREPTIIRQGDDRILIQVPGLSDPANLIKILNTTAKMSFQLVDESADPTQAARGIVPVGDVLLPQVNGKNGAPAGPPLVVQKRIMVAGDRLTDARAGFDPQTGEPVVNFRFDTVGAREFGDVTKNNVGHRFAIVLDNKVIEAPNIREPILGGSGQISGNFTTQSANDLSVLLRAGALPAPLTVVEQRTVGAELGADSVRAGRYSAMAGLLLVVVAMVLRYGWFGVFADVALTLNVVLLLAVLTLFGATLTLPGIAGIVLTMGMAVDANVLIYERILEEQHNGRGLLASIDIGFRRALATIIDANMTHLIAALILFQLGSGPVRGFAVTLGVGIITSFFTAVMVTRLIVVGWLNFFKPRKLAM